MREVMLPKAGERAGSIDVQPLTDNAVLGTSIGLVKEVNEDAVAGRIDDGVVRVCMADGHWGPQAAHKIAAYWMGRETAFPASIAQAREHATEIETQLWRAFGRDHMDADRDHTPEASFIAIEIDGDTLRATGYGDCRLLVVRDGKELFSLATKETWIGAFSHAGLRGRLPARTAVVFRRRQLKPGDYVLLFTDGLDQCIYGQQVLDSSTLVEATTAGSPETIFRALLDKAFAYGAEDNISLAVWKSQ